MSNPQIPDKPFESWPRNPYYHPPQSPGNSGFATTSMVLGICSVVFSWFTFGIPAILAVIFGVIGLKQTGPGKLNGRGQAITGLVLGIIMVLLGVYFSIWIIYGIGSTANDMNDYINNLPTDFPTPVN